MASVSVSIMAHPSRKRMVKDLRSRLDRDAEVVWDRIGDRIDTGTRAIATFDPSATHHLVIQDDALPCGRLIDTLESALDYVPPLAPVSLYVGRVSPFVRELQAVRRGTSWIRMRHVNWGLALALPTLVIEQVMKWIPSREEQCYDARVGSFFTEQLAQWCWYSWPSLVEHKDGPSLLDHGERRHAMKFVGERFSGSNFSGPIATIQATRPQR